MGENHPHNYEFLDAHDSSNPANDRNYFAMDQPHDHILLSFCIVRSAMEHALRLSVALSRFHAFPDAKRCDFGWIRSTASHSFSGCKAMQPKALAVIYVAYVTLAIPRLFASR